LRIYGGKFGSLISILGVGGGEFEYSVDQYLPVAQLIFELALTYSSSLVVLRPLEATALMAKAKATRGLRKGNVKWNVGSEESPRCVFPHGIPAHGKLNLFRSSFLFFADCLLVLRTCKNQFINGGKCADDGSLSRSACCFFFTLLTYVFKWS
jgi:hypothetical protein